MKNINSLRDKYWSDAKTFWPDAESPKNLNVRIGKWVIVRGVNFTQAQMLSKESVGEPSPLRDMLWNRANYMLTGCVVADNDAEFWDQF